MTGEREYLHGVLVVVFGHGVMLSGPSAVGKSELALELLSRGHQLLADDNVPVERAPDGRLHADGSDPIADFIALRDLGAVSVTRMFGPQTRCHDHPLDLVIRLRRGSGAPDNQDIAGTWKEIAILGVKVPQLDLRVNSCRPLALLVECAVREFTAGPKDGASWRQLSSRLRARLNPTP